MRRAERLGKWFLDDQNHDLDGEEPESVLFVGSLAVIGSDGRAPRCLPLKGQHCSRLPTLFLEIDTRVRHDILAAIFQRILMADAAIAVRVALPRDASVSMYHQRNAVWIRERLKQVKKQFRDALVMLLHARCEEEAPRKQFPTRIMEEVDHPAGPGWSATCSRGPGFM